MFRVSSWARVIPPVDRFTGTYNDPWHMVTAIAADF